MKYKRKDCYLLKIVADEGILLTRGSAALESNAVYVFNDTGITLWNYLDDFKSIEDITAFFVDKYNIEPETVRDDVTKCINKMIQNDLLDVWEETKA